MIKEFFKKKSQREEGECQFIGCSEPYTCFYMAKQVCSKHYFEVRRILSKKIKAKRQENTN